LDRVDDEETSIALEGLHHITAITSDAPGNVEFYASRLGLRLVKKTVNFDAPEVYHLYFGDEQGTPGSILTFFEFPGARRGRAGAGMVHRILWRVGSTEALDFWADRLGVTREGETVRFSDPEGLDHELVVARVPDAPLVAHADDIPAEHALQGFHGVRAYTAAPERSARLLDTLGFEDGELAGDSRRGVYHYDAPPPEIGIQGAGTIHHVAWSAADDAELTSVRERAVAAGAHATPIIDRQYFHSVYFREPSGVLFELASRDIGFTYDEPLETLGEALRLPPQHEHLRAHLERTLTPLVNPRAASKA
jgi:glyoxalase family protein